MKLKINLLIFAKKKKKRQVDFRRHCIEPVDQFEDCWHLNNIKSSNEHDISFHLLSFSFNLFQSNNFVEGTFYSGFKPSIFYHTVMPLYGIHGIFRIFLKNIIELIFK